MSSHVGLLEHDAYQICLALILIQIYHLDCNGTILSWTVALEDLQVDRLGMRVGAELVIPHDADTHTISWHHPYNAGRAAAERQETSGASHLCCGSLFGRV